MEEDYKPTVAEKKLLEALSEPENYTLSVTELCEKADIGRNTYYTLLKKPEFLKMRNEILNRVFDSLVPEVKRAAVKYAINNANNFQDRKMILEIAGEYKPTQNINVKDEDINSSKLEKELSELDKMTNK